MKKISAYVLILIMLLGFFGSSMTTVKAENLGAIQGALQGASQSGTLTPAQQQTANNVVKQLNTPTASTAPAVSAPTTPTQPSIPPCTGVATYDDKPENKGFGWENNHSCIDTRYHLLAPLPCDPKSTPGCVQDKNGNYTLQTFDPTAGQSNTKIGEYLNIMIRIFIGLCAVMSVIMIVIGGIEYMTSELISNKESGRERISNAVFGLLLALGAYALLNTINPDLLKTDLTSLEIQKVVVTDQANFAKTEQTTASVGTGYKLNGAPDLGVADFVKNYGASLSSITVDTASKKASFCSGTNCVSVPINTGYLGVAEAGQGTVGDNKTPKGTTTITNAMLGTSGNAVVKYGYNFGAAFVNIGVTANGIDRGIGFHGSASGALGTTNGCIRMNNDDLAALAPYMKAGTTVTIK